MKLDVQLVEFLQEKGVDVTLLKKSLHEFLQFQDNYSKAQQSEETFMVYTKKEKMLNFMKILREGTKE